MADTSFEDLKNTLRRLELVSAELLDETELELAKDDRQPQNLIAILERKHFITSYQATKLRKGESEALVLGNYKLLYRNASGSFARVFRACRVDDGSMVGLKVLRQRWASDPSAVRQFRREAELCMPLRHPNIVPIYEVGSQGDYHYFTMEFVEGGNLRELIKIRKKLSPVEATRCTLEMAAGLDYALSLGLTHRDMKMTNVLMGTDGVAKLVDFGLTGGKDVALRALEYATLEKGTHSPDNDPRSDLFFLGVIYYYLLAGVPAYPPSRKREERRKFARYSRIPPITEVANGLPQSVISNVQSLIAIDPIERFQRPSDAVHALQATLAELEKRSQESSDALPTVMCIESRVKQQDILRDYFSQNGFRVLVLSDIQRGLSRLTNNPPDCIVLMGESIGDQTAQSFKQAVKLGKAKSIVSILILAEKQSTLYDEMKENESDLARILVQPIALRDLRSEIDTALERSK